MLHSQHPAERLPLGQWIPKVEPRYETPHHLVKLLELLDRAKHEPVEAVIHAPPRHAKTETCLMAIAHWLTEDPEKKHIYCSYNADIADRKSAIVRDYARYAGVELRQDTTAKSYWRTTKGGGLLATGVGGTLTGFGVDGLLIIDDPFKDRVEAESAVIREQRWNWFTDVAYTRRERGASTLIIMARWHPDDLAGRLIKERGWPYICLPAIDEDGKALWPERHSVEELGKIKANGEYTWISLYQGRPRTRGGAVFKDVRTYRELPLSGMREAVGIDWAYTKKTSSDWSVAVEMTAAPSLADPKIQDIFITNVTRQQVRTDEWKGVLQTIRLRKPRAKFVTKIAGTEKGTVDLMGMLPNGVQIEAYPAIADKFIRAQPFAAAWNSAHVHVPEAAPWLDLYLSEVLSFTGINDDHDDQVDASAAAYDALAPTSDVARFLQMATR